MNTVTAYTSLVFFGKASPTLPSDTEVITIGWPEIYEKKALN